MWNSEFVKSIDQIIGSALTVFITFFVTLTLSVLGLVRRPFLDVVPGKADADAPPRVASLLHAFYKTSNSASVGR